MESTKPRMHQWMMYIFVRFRPMPKNTVNLAASAFSRRKWIAAINERSMDRRPIDSGMLVAKYQPFLERK